MRALDYFKNRCYQVKYRTPNGCTGIIISKGKKDRQEYEERLDRLAAVIAPCERTASEVIGYIIAMYGAEPTEMSEASIANLKINYIINMRPELLTTPEPDLGGNGKMPSRKEFLKNAELLDKRFTEARSYPIEALNADFRRYEFDFTLSSGSIAHFHVDFELTGGYMSAGSSVNAATDCDNREIRRILNDIDLFRGVSESDIKNRTPRFLGYAAAFEEKE